MGASLGIWLLDLGIPITWELILLVIVAFIGGRISDRFSCMAYGVSFIYLVDLLLIAIGAKETFFNLPYARLMILVGVLHTIEGILTIFFGAKDNKCIITYSDDELAGGYQSYRRWYIPLFLFILKDYYLPIIAGLLFVSDTFTMQPEKKARRMGFCILVYGIVMLLLGSITEYGDVPMILMMLAMPILHDVLLAFDKVIEGSDMLYTQPKKGIRILEVSSDTNNFRRGDVIVAINGERLKEAEDYIRYLEKGKERVYLEIYSLHGERRDVICSKEELNKSKLVLLPRE